LRESLDFRPDLDLDFDLLRSLDFDLDFFLVPTPEFDLRRAGFSFSESKATVSFVFFGFCLSFLSEDLKLRRPLLDFDLDFDLDLDGDFDFLLDLRVDFASSEAFVVFALLLSLVLSFSTRLSARGDSFGKLNSIEPNLGGAVESKLNLARAVESKPLLLIQSPSPNFFRRGDTVYENSVELIREVGSVESRLFPVIQLLSSHFFLEPRRSPKMEFDLVATAMIWM